MRVFLDECVDWRLGRHISGHEVKTARQMGWTAITNGKLLTLAAAEFDAFVTVDRNLSFQQNVATYEIAVIVIRAPTNRLTDLLSIVPGLLLALISAKAGDVTLIGGPD